MWARKRFDIGWRDLGFAALRSFLPTPFEELALEPRSARDARIFECLSVRTGFDLLLADSAFPQGSEVLMSALNIEGMFRIVEAHGLVPVPLDIDRQRLVPSTSAVRDAITPKTRMIVIAHLFGSYSMLESINQLCVRHNLLLVEDCSQSFAGIFERPQGACIAHMYSFGSIKTATSLGGAVLTLRDAEVAHSMRTTECEYPALSRTWFLRRIAKYACLKALSYRWSYALLMRAFGRRHDAVVSRIARGFGDVLDLRRIRKRPPAPMISLLARRLRSLVPEDFEQARQRGKWLARRLEPQHTAPGALADTHLYSLFPVLAEDPAELIERLAETGFDATMRGSLVVAPTRAGNHSRLVEVACHLLEHMVFVPFYDEMPDKELTRMAAIICKFNPVTAIRFEDQGGFS